MHHALAGVEPTSSRTRTVLHTSGYPVALLSPVLPPRGIGEGGVTSRMRTYVPPAIVLHTSGFHGWYVYQQNLPTRTYRQDRTLPPLFRRFILVRTRHSPHCTDSTDTSLRFGCPFGKTWARQPEPMNCYCGLQPRQRRRTRTAVPVTCFPKRLSPLEKCSTYPDR